jgi:hypothetical protein
MTNAVEEKSQDRETVVLTSKEPVAFFSNSDFKYYIHDTAEGYRLQLSGDFTDHQVSELNSCWLTARNTLRDRKLILDLREVKHVDERGKQWLAGMGLEGASYVPESFLRDAMAGDAESRTRKKKMRFNVFDRLLSALRSCNAPAK